MNEEAINDGYQYFVETGYQGTIDDYKALLNTNEDAVNDTYKHFVETGYNGTVNDFVTLFGIGEKKNLVGNGTGEEEVMVSDTEEVQEPGSSESLETETNDVETINIGEGNQVNPENLIQPETISTEETEFVTPDQEDTTDFFEESLQQITPDLISKTEENVVPLMNYHFNDYGFTFKEADFTGDEMKVEAANGEKLSVELDALFFKGKYSDELKQFLKDNKEESSKLQQLESGYIKKQAKIQNKKEVDEINKNFSDEASLIKNEIEEYLAAKNFYDSNNIAEKNPDEVIYVEGPDGNQMSTTPKVLAEKLAIAQQNIRTSQKNLRTKSKELDESLGNWYEMRSKQKSILGLGYNAFLDGAARIATQNANRIIDFGTYVQGPVGSGLMSEDDYRTKVLTKARESGALGDTYTDERIQEIISNNEEYQNILDIIKNTPGVGETISVAGSIKEGIPASEKEVSRSLLDNIESKILDELRKDIKSDVIPAVRGGLRETIGMSETTIEATKKTKEDFWGGALLGVTESIPAMLGPAPIRVFNMISQVEDHVMEEMANNPEFDDVTEGEKVKFTIPLGIVVGVLENLGFRNAIAQKGLASKILLRVLNKHGKDITGKTFREVVKKEVNSMVAQGSLVVSAAGLAEFETGLAQEIADIGFKEAYNAMKDKDMFNTPESFGDGVKQVIRAGAQEAVGGFVIGTPSAIATVASTGDFTKLADGIFEMYEDIHNEPVVRDAFIQKTKERILNNEITKEEGQREIDMYDKVNGVMDQIPSDLPTNQKKELLGNLLRQQELQDDIDKYNKQLTKRQQQELLDLENDVERIVRSGNTQNQQEAQETELNTQAINELKEEGIENPTPEQIKTKRDAIQEPSTETVDVQESTEGSQEVGERDTQGEPTQESIESETDIDTQTQEEVEDLTSIFNEQTGMQEQEGTPEQTDSKVKTKGVEVDSENDNVTIEKNDGTKVTLPGVSVSENVSVTETAGDPKAVRILPSLLRQAKNAGKAIAKLMPDANIVLHATEDAYNQAVSEANKGTRGTFSPTTNTIHINAPQANTRTVAHEVMHAVLLKKLGINADFNKVTKRMLDAVVKAMPKDSNLKEVIEDFANDYAIEEQNEEQVSELFGYLSAAYTKLDGPTKNIVKRWLQKAAKAVGLPVNITEFTKEEADMIEFFNTVSKKVREGTEVTEGDIEVIDDGTAPIGTPTTINKPSKTEKPQIDFKKSYDMSLVTPKNKIDLLGLVDNIIKNDEKVWFWVADQLGLGNGMDAGPSFALQPENIKKGAIWASGLDQKKLDKNITAADFIFIISGSPETSKLFNKKVFDKYANNLGDYNTFKKKALATNPTKAIRETLQEFDSWPAMRRNPKRKTFLIAVNEQSKKPNTEFHALVNTLGGFVDLQSLRDGFYKENEFAQNDIMMVLKPTGLGGKSNHSTYTYDILGEVVGVPDIKLNAKEIMPEAIKAKIEGKGISEQTSSIAPFGGATPTAVKSVTKPATEKAQVITEQDIEILYPEKAQKRSFDFTQAEVDAALNSDTKSVEVIAKGLQPKQGEKVGVRLNLNVLKNKGVPIQTVHQGQVGDNYKKVNGISGFFKSTAINYAPAVTLKDVYLNAHQEGVYKIKEGYTHKTPIASVDGLYQDVSLADTNFDGVEIRFNPMRGGLFVTADGNRPVRSVEEATIVGHRVYGRGKIEYFTEANKPKEFVPDAKWLSKNKKIKKSEKAQLPDGYSVKETGKGEFVLMKGIRRAGELSISELQTSTPSVSQVYIKNFDRGLGLAPDMYREIAKAMEAKGKTLVSSQYTNDASQGVWQRLVKDGDAIVIGGRTDYKGVFRPQYSMRNEASEKAQKASVDKLAKMYEMKKNGVIFNKPGVNRVALEDWANSLGFTVKVKRGDVGELTGFKLIQPDGKVYTPTKEKAQRSVDEKAQKTFNKFDSPLEIINKARDLNFTDPAILDFLTRVRKFTKTEVRDLMKVNADLLNIIPPSMGNIKGGMKAGIKLFNKVSNHYNKLITKNAKAKTKLSEQEIMDQAMDFLRAQPEYKKMADAVLKGISTEQMVLEMDVAKALGGKQSTNLNAAIRKARIILRAKTKGKKELRKIQRELRNFMRKTLPADIYSKSEAIKLMRKIEQANKDNINEIMNEVMEFAAQKNNVRLHKSIDDLLDPKNTLKKISNILKGVKIDETTRKRLASLKKRIDDGSLSTQDKVLEYIYNLETEYDNINKQPEKTEGDYTAMADLQIIMNMVKANNLMSNEDITKVNVLAGVETELKQIITAGRTILKEQLRKAHLEYQRQFEQVFLDVTGRTESFKDQAKKQLKEEGVENPTEAEIQDQITDIIENIKDTKDSRGRDESGTSKKKIKVKERFKKLGNEIVFRLGNVMAKNSDLFLLMDKISLLPAELFEGNTQEEVTKKIDAANREMKGRMLMNDALIISKFQELFGKKYKSIVTSFGRKTEAIDLPDGTEMVLSPNQMYYLYNQYKDSANHPGLQKTFSTDEKGVAKVMNEITTRLESEQYKNLKEFADWQVEILYPMLYNHYNEAYQDIYRTQMPYNVNYAGMVYREGQEAEGVNLIPGADGGKIQYHNVVAANSTKMREQNKKKIRPMDGTNVLYTYMRDMEYFSAYARPVNDINKLFTNDVIKSEIERLHGKPTMDAITAAIQKIANKGTFKENAQMDNAVDIMQDLFILSRLGINPVVTLKQLTSFITYASDIGYGNWMKNAALSRFGKGKDVKAIWKEISENSTYLQDRDAKSMTKAIEMYSDDAMESVFPDIKVGGKKLMTGANKESLINILMYTTKVGDRGAIYLGGVPNYVYYKNKALEAGKTEQEAIDEAIIKFERDTKRSQQSTDLQDRDYYQTKGPIFRALNMFLTTPKQYLRKEVYALRNMYRLMSSGGKSGKGNMPTLKNFGGDAGRIFLTYHVIMPVFFQFVANGMPGLLADWEDEDAKDLGMAAILGNINALFIYGEFAVKIKDLIIGKPQSFLKFKNLPILTQGEEIFQRFARYRDTKDPKKKQEALYKALAETSQITGLPVNNVRKIFKNMEQLIEGGEDPAKVIMRLFNFSEYQIQNEAERKRNKKSKRKAKKKADSNPMISGDPMNTEDPMNDKTDPMLYKNPME